MAKIASRVILIEAEQALTATAVLQERVSSHPKVEILCGTTVTSINGKDRVEALELEETNGTARSTRDVDGLLVHVGLEPNTGYLAGIVPLNSEGEIIVNEKMETAIPFLFAAGDIRSGSPRQVATAVGDGVIAALSAERFLL